jgi:glycosyltransferase involved in cell wall biosynthesis
MQPAIYVDLRCLQDENYRVRGIGLHVAALLRAREQSAFATNKTIGLVDARLPKILPEFHPLVDEITYSTNPCCNDGPAVFLDGSPMGHDTRFTTRFLHHPAFLRAAVLYDFIPLDWPGYLPALASRIDYLAKLARLRKFDLLFPISKYTARRASELLGLPGERMIVTGASVRRNIYQVRERLGEISSPYDRQDPYFFVIFGGDLRKNVELAVKAVRHLNLVHARRVPLKVAGHYDLKGSGHYDAACKRNLLRLAGHAEGKGFLEFCPLVSDEELVSLYSGAVATIVPSHIEGFSLPVVEASACGCPAVVSTCAAHLELVNQPEALFASTDVAALCGKLDALLNDPGLRDTLRAAQAHLRPKFHEDAVGGAFWSGLEVAAEKHTRPAASGRPKKPRIAFLSPYPPDQSDAASYTAMTIRAGEALFESDIYTAAARPLVPEGRLRDAGAISVVALLNGQYKAIVSVIGADPSHSRVLDVFKHCGGPCIIFDTSPALESVVERAAPLIVHTKQQRIEIKKRYGVEAQVLPLCPRNLFSEEELGVAERQKARERCGIRSATFVVSTFGDAARENWMQNCIAAIDLLRSWNIPAELYFVGSASVENPELDRITLLYGLARCVHYRAGLAGNSTYRDFLIASDAAIQLRSGVFGASSIGLSDCISAGLPCIATKDVMLSCDAPGYVSAVPERYSALQVAEQLALIWETQPRREAYADARAAYIQGHNFEQHARRLVEILGIA